MFLGQSDRAYSICFHDKIKSEVNLNICSRHKIRQFQDQNIMTGRGLTVKDLNKLLF